MIKTSSALFALLAVLTPTPQDSQGQDKPKTFRAPGSDKRLVLEPGTHTLEDLINDSARFLGRNYLFSAQEIGMQQKGSNSIELQNKLVLDEQGAEEVTSQLLYTKGFVLTPIDAERKVYEWILINGPRRTDIMTRAITLPVEEVLSRTALKVVVTTTLPLKHVSASVITNGLRPLFAQSSTGTLTFSAVSPRVFVITGFAGDVAKAIRIVQEADQPGTEPVVGLEERLLEKLARLETRVAALEKSLEKKPDAAK